MKPTTSPIIVVLGAHGMLGHTVFNYLKIHHTVWGTTKNSVTESHLLKFDAYNYNDLNNLYKKVKKIDYIINCIGALPRDTNEKMTFINAQFPNKLATIAEKNNSYLIHVSSDAVFSPLSNDVYENDSPFPIDEYGKSKLQGEPKSTNAFSIRTSLLGLDPYKHKGLLEYALQEKRLTGFMNQVWSGSTTLQFAHLCHQIIKNNAFEQMRQKSSIFHFAPLTDYTKHDIIKTLQELIKNDAMLVMGEGEQITRSLKTNYQELLKINQFTQNLKRALYELLLFEKTFSK